ncbi:hypothetical protein LGN00_09465, partial [Burkholderia cepacia]|nr:hypothetical protein [Burkholderia cepacia]
MSLSERREATSRTSAAAYRAHPREPKRPVHSMVATGICNKYDNSKSTYKKNRIMTLPNLDMDALRTLIAADR